MWPQKKQTMKSVVVCGRYLSNKRCKIKDGINTGDCKYSGHPAENSRRMSSKTESKTISTTSGWDAPLRDEGWEV